MQGQNLVTLSAAKHQMKAKSCEKAVGLKSKVLSEMEVEKNASVLCKDAAMIHKQEKKLKNLQEYRKIFCGKPVHERVIYPNSLDSNDNEAEESLGHCKKSSREVSGLKTSRSDERLSRVDRSGKRAKQGRLKADRSITKEDKSKDKGDVMIIKTETGKERCERDVPKVDQTEEKTDRSRERVNRMKEKGGKCHRKVDYVDEKMNQTLEKCYKGSPRVGRGGERGVTKEERVRDEKQEEKGVKKRKRDLVKGGRAKATEDNGVKKGDEFGTKGEREQQEKMAISEEKMDRVVGKEDKGVIGRKDKKDNAGAKIKQEDSLPVQDVLCKKEKISSPEGNDSANNEPQITKDDERPDKTIDNLTNLENKTKGSGCKFLKLKGKLKSSDCSEFENKPSDPIKNINDSELLKAKSNPNKDLTNKPKPKFLPNVEQAKSSELVKSNYSCSLTGRNIGRSVKRKLSLPQTLSTSARVTKHRTMPSFKKLHGVKDFASTSLGKHSTCSDVKPVQLIKAGGEDTLQSQPDFQFISEELSFLNSESGKLATQIHKSDKEKRLDRKRKGMFIRNMLKKKKLCTKKYRKPEKLEKRNEPELLSDSADSSDMELEIDSSSDFEFEMDRRLEENARRNNLSVMNVKSILHSVITNEHVVAMMNNTLKSTGEVEGELTEAVFEPKMTRSKIKEVLEKSDGLTPWLLPSAKTISESKVSILDIPFNEDEEEDDDYNPDKDVTAEVESDDDVESVNSSLVCSPSISKLVSSPISQQKTEEENNNNNNVSLIEDDEKKDDETEETIARRTRSKLPLHDTSLMELEANFVAPDITQDMYDTECNDKDWQDFLKSLTKSEYVEDPTETLDDEANDPEYNYLEEAEQECLDDEDFRDDRMVRVTKKELHSLLDELFNDEGNEEDETVVQPGPLMKMDFSSSKEASNLNAMVTPEQQAIIREHVKQHVQLLSQTVLLTQHLEGYSLEHANALQLVNEIDRFGNNSLAGEKSVFRACNLKGALQLLETHKDVTFREKVNYKELPNSLKSLFSENSCFLYPQLLPEIDVRPKTNVKDKCTFYQSQDYLLTLGFEQFQHFPSYMMCKCIRQLLLPCKTEKQIRSRIKNMRSKRAKDNPIKIVQQTKKLPENFPHATLSGVQEMIAPKFNVNHPQAPSWLKKCVSPPSKKKSPTAKMQSKSENKRSVNTKKKLAKDDQMNVKINDSCVKSVPVVVVMQPETCPVPAEKLNHSHPSLVAPAISFSSSATKTSSDGVQLTPPPTTTTSSSSSLTLSSSPQKTDSSNPVIVVTSSINAIATVASQILTTSPLASACNPHFISEALAKQQELQKTPTKNLVPVFKPFQKALFKISPMYKPLAPKPLQISPPAFRQVSPLLEKKRNSPRRQELQQKARLICPKAFVIKQHFSPTHRAAYSLRKRATRSPWMTRSGEPRTILPKNSSPSPSTSNACCNLNSERLKKVASVSKDSGPLNNALSSTRSGSSRKNANDSTQSSSSLKGSSQNLKSSEKRHSGSSSVSVGSGSNPCEADEAKLLQNRDSHIEDLMAASSTINSNLKRSKDTRTKAQKRNDIKLAMLAPNLIEKDPRRDHRDTIFAQAYLTKVKQTLKDDMDQYEKFLKILFEFGKSDHSPVVLYKSLSYLLSDYPELIHDLAGFLSPEHALQCGCYNTTMDFLKARNFLRKIEIIFEKHPSQYQKVLRIFAEWQHKNVPKEKELYDMLLPMFKGQDQLLVEFSGLFGFHTPPESHSEDFEEVVLDGTDTEFSSKLTGFEDVELPDEANRYGLPGCPCQCHKDKKRVKGESQEKKKNNTNKRQPHCSLCGLTVKDGKLYYKMPGKWKQARATISEAVHLNHPEEEAEPEDVTFLLGNLKPATSTSISASTTSSSSILATEAASSIINQPKKSIPVSTSFTTTFTSSRITKPFDQKSFVPLNEILNSSSSATTTEIKTMKFWSSDEMLRPEASLSVSSNTGDGQTTAKVTEISSGQSSDILAKAWEQAGKSPQDERSELDDNLMQELLEIPLKENPDNPSKAAPTPSIASQIVAPTTVIGPNILTDFLLPGSSEATQSSPSLVNTNLTSTLPASPARSAILLPPLNVNSQSSHNAVVTVLPLSSVTLFPHANQANVQTVNINNQLAVGRHIVPGFPRRNGISLNRNVISKSRTRLSPKSKKEETLNSILNLAMGKRNQQMVTSPIVVSMETSSPKSVTAVKLQCAPETVERWTKIMDKLILDTTKDHGATSEVFEFLSTKIQGKTPKEIKTRYGELLQYLECIKR